MRTISARIAALIAIAMLGSASLDAQEGAAASGSPLPVLEATGRDHGKDEENALSRFAIVACGSFPIMLLYSDFSFDVGRYVAAGFDAYYAPWPFKSEFSYQPSDAEKALRIGVAVGASVTVGAIDYLIRRSKAKKEKLRRDALMELAEATAKERSLPEALPKAAVEP